MNITEVKVFPIDEEKLKAFVSIVFDGCFMVNDIKIIQGREGRFISMPSRRKKNGEFKDVAHPLNNQTRGMIESVVLAEYDRMMAEGVPARPPARRPEARPQVHGMAPASTGRVAAAEMSAVKLPVSKVAEPAEKTLEEVAEAHLRDSFWTS